MLQPDASVDRNSAAYKLRTRNLLRDEADNVRKDLKVMGVGAVAEKYSVSTGALYSHFDVRAFTRGRIAERRAKVHALVKQGMTNQQIADYLGEPCSTVGFDRQNRQRGTRH